MIQLGYCCINLSIPLSPNQGMIKRTFESKGIEYAGELAVANIKNLIEIIKWNESKGIKVYRMSSNMFPWMSEYEITELPQFDKIKNLLKGVGLLSIKYGQRLGFHPGPFNQLGSVNDRVVKKTVKELNQSSQIMDLMNLPTSQLSHINIHVGNATNGKEEATKRFCENFSLLDENTQKRLVVENDDKAGLYTTQELYDLVYKRIKTPITFDYLHHYCNPGELSEKEAFELAITTWPVKPCFHYSSSRKLNEDENSKLLAHADYVYEFINDYNYDIDIEVEAKAKELAILKYIKGNQLIES